MVKWFYRAVAFAVLFVAVYFCGADLCAATEGDVAAELPDFRLEAEAVLAGGCYDNYISEKLAEFANDSPETLALVGEGRVRLFAAMAVARGVHYNMDAERELNGLYTMMLFLGSEFDSDPLYPWARFPVFPVKDYTEENPESWVYLLEVWRQFLDFYQSSAGYSDGEYTYKPMLKAYRRVKELRFDEIARLDGEAAVKTLAKLYPERFAQMPETALYSPVLENAARAAEEYGMPTPAGRNLFLGIFFYCGNSADKNPLYEPLFEGLKEMAPRGLNKERELFKRFMKMLRVAGR